MHFLVPNVLSKQWKQKKRKEERNGEALDGAHFPWLADSEGHVSLYNWERNFLDLLLSDMEHFKCIFIELEWTFASSISLPERKSGEF